MEICKYSASGSCRAVFDTGTSLLGGPSEDLDTLLSSIGMCYYMEVCLVVWEYICIFTIYICILHRTTSVM